MKNLFFALTLFVSAAHAGQPVSPGVEPTSDPRASINDVDVRRGWFFYQDPKKPEEPPEQIQVPELAPDKKPQQPKEEECKKRKTWKPTCGFVDPGMDMEFQSQQRDQLMQQMALSRNDPKAVEAVQYYMKWVMDRSMEVANAWAYNMAQNPELDPTLGNPVSEFGLKLMAEVKSSESKDIFRTLAKETILVYFSRADCIFCIQMARTYENVQRETGIQVWNAPLDGVCIEPFKDKCVKGDAALKSAGILQVDIVPSLFLYTKPNVWIRVSNGLSATEEITNRIVNFTASYRRALLTGVQNASGMRPNMDFSGDPVSGAGAGIKLPTQAEISQMLGSSGK